jgi:hypothetical protein
MNNLFTYIDKLELIAFFSAFPLFYFFLIAFYSKPLVMKFKWLKSTPEIISIVYATISLLYVGMKLNQWYEQILIGPIQYDIYSYIFIVKCWSIFGLIFFFKSLRSKPMLALAHSSIYFIILLIDFFQYYHHQYDIEAFHNEMRLYFIGLLAYLIISFVFFLATYLRFKFVR